MLTATLVAGVDYRPAAARTPPPSGAPPAAAGSAPGDGWTDAPRYAALFAPRRHAEAYRAQVSPVPLDALLSRMTAASCAGPARPVNARDAFGPAAGYNPWALARLYGPRSPLVLRCPRIEDGQVVAAWTLVSPYPDPRMERLEPGTLLLQLDLR